MADATNVRQQIPASVYADASSVGHDDANLELLSDETEAALNVLAVGRRHALSCPLRRLQHGHLWDIVCDLDRPVGRDRQDRAGSILHNSLRDAAQQHML